MKNITQSSWNALNVPIGIAFDSSRGIFSGTPNVGAGEYVVPVSVATNYGSDSKDVRFIVEDAPHGVYALGSQAARWSNYAEPDAYGFRKLDIPNANRLSTVPAGFAAKCVGGKWFIGSSKNITLYGGNGKSDGISYYMPTAFPIDNVLDIKGAGFRFGSSTSYRYYFAFRTNDETSTFKYNISSGNVISCISDSRNDILSFQNGFSSNGWAMLKDDYTLVINNPGQVTNNDIWTFIPDERIVKFVPFLTYSNSIEAKIYFISESGKLFEFKNSYSNNSQSYNYTISQLIPERDDFIDLWFQGTGDNVFALTADKSLYARGTNFFYQLGINVPSNFTEFQLIGNFDVKKIEYPFMLTRDGKLYHSGAAISGVIAQHSGWTHVFPEHKFLDFSCEYYAAFGTQTLVAILDD